MNETFQIQVRDENNTLVYLSDCDKLLSPFELVEVMEEFKKQQKDKTVSLTITQWMPDLKGYITIGEGY